MYQRIFEYQLLHCYECGCKWEVCSMYVLSYSTNKINFCPITPQKHCKHQDFTCGTTSAR